MFVAGFDVNTGDLKWRTFLMPPCGDPTTCGPGKDGPLFLAEKAEWGQWLVDNCDKIWISMLTGQQIKACQMDQDILRNDWGDMRSNSGISNVWGQMAIDEEKGVVYFGMAQAGPDYNATYRPGPNLFGASVMALNANNGELIWAHQTTAHDLWDFDCAWNTIITTTVVQGQERDVVIKGCKNGIVYVFDAETGEALHMLEAPIIRRTPQAMPLDPLSVADMTKPWQNWPEIGGVWQNCFAAGCIESDIAFDEERGNLYFGVYNAPSYVVVGDAETRGRSLAGCGGACRDARGLPDNPERVGSYINTTIVGYDVDTGNLLWEYFIPELGFRGGTIVSGGLVWFAGVDGWSRALSADTGEVLYELNTGSSSVVQPTIGADADGNMLLFRVIGGRGWFLPGMGTSQPGAIMAFGLPDVLPEPEIVEVIREVEVPGPERIVEVEVEVPGPERIVEVPVEVEIQTISPISYVAIGVGIVLVVVAGILFTRRRPVS